MLMTSKSRWQQVCFVFQLEMTFDDLISIIEHVKKRCEWTEKRMNKHVHLSSVSVVLTLRISMKEEKSLIRGSLTGTTETTKVNRDLFLKDWQKEQTIKIQWPKRSTSLDTLKQAIEVISTHRTHYPQTHSSSCFPQKLMFPPWDCLSNLQCSSLWGLCLSQAFFEETHPTCMHYRLQR